MKTTCCNFVLFLFLLLKSYLSFSQIIPPPVPSGTPFADKNELPQLIDCKISPSDIHQSDAITFFIEASDDSKIVEIYIKWKESTLGEWVEVVSESYSFDPELNVYSTTIAIQPDVHGDLDYLISLQDDETGRFVSDTLSLTILPAIPQIPSEFEVLESRETSVVLQWDAADFCSEYIVQVSIDESFSNDIIQKTIGVDYTANSQHITFDTLITATTYYARIKSKNSLYESSYSDPVSFFTSSVLPEIDFISDNYDFDLKVVGDTVVFDFSVKADTLFNTLIVTPPVSMELSIDSLNWFSFESPLEFPLNEEKSLNDTTIYCRLVPTTSGAYSDFIVFSSEGMNNSLFKVSGFVQSKTPNQSPLLSEVYCNQSGSLYTSWSWDETKEIPENVLLMFVPFGSSFTLNNGSDPTEFYSNGFNGSDGIGYFIQSSSNLNCIIPLPPSGKSYQVILVGLNGSGNTCNYHSTSPKKQGEVVTRKSDLPQMWINELVYDVKGTDTGFEKVEIFSYGILEREKVRLVVYKGSTGAQTKIYEDDGSKDAYLIKGSNSYLVIETPSLPNTTTGLALVYDNELIEFLSYEGEFEAVEGIAEGIMSKEIYDGSDIDSLKSIQKISEPTVEGDYWVIADTTWLAKNELQTIIPDNTTIWQGNEYGDWDDEENWSNGIPNVYSHVVIPENKKIEILESDEPKLQTITMEPDAQMIGEEYLPTNTPAYVQRDFDVDRWTYFCSPVECLHADWLTPEKGVLYLIEYNMFDTADGNWKYITDQNRTLTPLEGYGLYNSRENVCFCFSGFLCDTTLSVELNYSSDLVTNYNFVGNSFVSAIKWPIVDMSNITGTAYLYDPNIEGYRTIGSDGVVAGVLVDSETPPSEIPPLQGFFVESSNEGAFVLHGNDRVFGSENFLKSGVSEIEQLRMVVSNGTSKDCSVIYASEEGEDDFNPISDSKKMFYYDYNVPQIATYLNTVPVAINHLREFSNSIEFGIVVQNNQLVDLSITNLSNLLNQSAGYELVRVGKEEVLAQVEGDNLKIQLYCTSGQAENRFIIRAKRVTDSSDLLINDWYISQNQGEVTVCSKFGKNQKLEIYDLHGSLVYFKPNPNIYEETVYLNVGVYIVKWNDQDSRKVIVY